MPKRDRSRGFSFTYWLDTGYGEEELLGLDCAYMIYQYELAPTTDRVHIQGYMRYDDAVAYSYIHEQCPGIWIEKAKASEAKNVRYCSKLASRIAGPYEHGDRPKQGYRSDLSLQYEMVKSGKTPLDVVAEIPEAARHIKHLQTYSAAITNRSKDFVPKVYIRWGPSGTGKTRWCYDTYGHDGVFKLAYNKTNAWWDGYANQKCILIDDWPLQDKSQLHVYHWLLEWTDRYPTWIPFKGGMTRLGESDIVVTSNEHPLTWFGGEGLRALERRVTSVDQILTTELDP